MNKLNENGLKECRQESKTRESEELWFGILDQRNLQEGEIEQCLESEISRTLFTSDLPGSYYISALSAHLTLDICPQNQFSTLNFLCSTYSNYLQHSEKSSIS